MADRGGIPIDPGARGRWLAQLRRERSCDTARACIDTLAEVLRGLDDGVGIDDRVKICKAAGELLSRAVAADKHAEVLETAELRRRSDAQRGLSEELGRGLH